MRQIDAVAHVRGDSRFVDDVPPPANMLHAVVFGSPLAHGKLLSLDLTAAKGAEGVVAVLTCNDIPGENQIGPIIPDEPLLVSDEVTYIGQPLAVVVAESRLAAGKATALMSARIEPLPIITDPREAYARDEIIGVPRTLKRGNVEAAWDDCDEVIEGQCSIGGQEHVYLETQRARAIPLEGGRLLIHASTQSPYAGQRTVARTLGLPYNAVEVDVLRLGGAFGGKEDQATQWACIAALGAWHTRRPVELVLNRGEDFRMTGKRHPYEVDFKIGVMKDGAIHAFQANYYQNAGAGADLSPAVLERTMLHGTNSYDIPHVHLHGVSCRTNLPPNTAFRGFGGPQGMFVIESAIAAAADALGMTREKIQRKNLIAAGGLFPYGQAAKTSDAQVTWDEADTTYGLEKIQRDVAAYNASHFETKRGVAVMPVCFGISFTTTFLNQASALVHVYTDGSVGVSTGGVEMGQGLNTNLATVAARALGIDIGRVRIESTNTTRIANMSPSAASSTTLLNGNAIVIAAGQIVDRLKSVAAAELGVDNAAEITIEQGQVLKGGRSTDLSWDQLVQTAYMQRVSLSAHAYYATPDIHYDKVKEEGSPFAYHVYGAAITEVTLDCLRGTYDIDAVKIVHALGRTINEQIDIGQVEGGLAQGLGWMTVEDLQYDHDGALLSHALATYKVPDAAFMPDDIKVKFLTDSRSSAGPYGSKAVGEPPLMYGIGLFFALRHAMAAFRPGLDMPFTAPLTPERVLMTLHPDTVPVTA